MANDHPKARTVTELREALRAFPDDMVVYGPYPPFSGVSLIEGKGLLITTIDTAIAARQAGR